MLQTPTPLRRRSAQLSLKLSPRRPTNASQTRRHGAKLRGSQSKGLALRSSRKRFCLYATSELETTRRTFHRFREFVKFKDGKRTEDELRSYCEDMHYNQVELMKQIDELNNSGPIADFMLRRVVPVVLEAFENFSEHAHHVFTKAEDGYIVTNGEYLKELEKCMTLRVRMLYGIIAVGSEAGKTLVVSAGMVIILRLCGVDIFQNFMSPVHGWRLDWCLWTLPYAVATYFFWNSAIARKWDPLKGFKFSTHYEAFRRFVMKNPRSYHDAALLVQSIHVAWVTTLYQGLGFFIFEAIYPQLYGVDFYSFGFFMASPLPSIVWLPVELLFLSSASGAFHLITDWSLIVPADAVLKDKARFFTMDARIAAKNFLEFHLLDDPQITRTRAIVTFLYYFGTVGYLSSEAIAVHSLFASMATLTIGHYLTFKGMQKIPL